MKTIYPFASIELPNIEIVGGKALSLITMTREGMPVPPGFVLTVEFFDPWKLIIQAAPEYAALRHASPVEISAKMLPLQSLCRQLRFSTQQQFGFQEALDTFQAVHPNSLFAVRSSSPEEDLDRASFAGSYETLLGVKTEDLQSAISQLYASSFDERVYLYRKEQGFSADPPSLAVIVQQQVDANSAGVAFSINPVNNCYDEVVINANYGLGESVVSGDVDPDVFVVDKPKREIIETHIGAKQAVTALNHAGGTIKSAHANHQEASITPEQVLQLTELLGQVEAYYQKPMDIEWAYTDKELVLLQARPITTYLPLPAEMVTAPGEPKRLYANSTLIEQGFQGPMSVLGTDFLGYVLKQVGGPVNREAIGPGGITFTAGGGYYMNISYALKIGMGRSALAPGSFGDPQVTEIMKNMEMKQYLSGELPGKLRRFRSKMVINMLPLAKSILSAYLRPDRILRKYQAALPGELKRFEMLPKNYLSLDAQASQLTERLQFFYGEYGIPMVLAGQMSLARIKSLFRQEANQVQDHLTNLGVALPGNKTTEMGELMVALAASAEISKNESAAGFMVDLQNRRFSPKFRQAWEQFMDEFGARCPGEIDAATPRPKEHPVLLYEQLKNMSLAARSSDSSTSFFEEARAKREAAYQALYKIALKKGNNKARALEKYYKTWVTFGGYRETPKHYIIKVVDIFRRKALTIAEKFLVDGRLDKPEQIFDLTISDIDRGLGDPALDLRALAQERSLLINRIRKSHLVVRIIDSRGRIYYPPHQAAADGEFRGVPISPGIIQGRVKVLHYANEKKLLSGEILVARATDPGWTPLFINTKGIILEIGGALQHGAVVAREYGIPCVSGVFEATTRLVDGQMVEVDGSNGTVRILKGK